MVAAHGELLHVRCRLGWSDATQRLVAFLTLRENERFCHTCLITVLDVTYEEVRKAVAALRAPRRVRVSIATCSQCTAPRVTVEGRSARASAEESEFRERIIERLQVGSLPRFLVAADQAGPVEAGLFTGPGTGKLCSACDAVLDGRGGRSLEFVMPPGRVLRFHRRCYEIWDEERHKARPR